MKRIFILWLAVVLLLAITSSGTIGSFNDTETSTDNQLTLNWYTPTGFFYVTNDGTDQNGGEDKLFVYDATGVLMSSLSFLLAGTNATPSGAATAGDYIYVLDQLEQRVYRYPSGGGIPQASKYLKKPGGSALSNARGLAISGNELWVTRYGANTPILYCYSLTDAFSGPGDITPSISISPPTEGNKHPTGLAIDEDYLYVLDRADKKIYGYHRYDNSLRFISRELRGTGGTYLDSPNGLACDGSSIWVVDSGTDKVYQYDLSSLIAGAHPVLLIQAEVIEAAVVVDTIEATWEFPLDAANNNATGM